MEDDYYDLEMKEEPCCQVVVDFRAAADAETFVGVVHAFAREHDLIEQSDSEPPVTGPMRMVPTLLGPDLLLAAFYFVGTAEDYGQAKLSLLRRDGPRTMFRRRAETFAARFGEAFFTRARVTVSP